MKIGFVVNDVMTEQPVYTTVRLAMQATNMGHEAFLMGMGDFAYEVDGSLSARARGVSGKNYRSTERYLADVQMPDLEQQISLSAFDVVMLRSDPAADAAEPLHQCPREHAERRWRRYFAQFPLGRRKRPQSTYRSGRPTGEPHWLLLPIGPRSLCGCRRDARCPGRHR